MNACQPRNPQEVVQDILAIEEAITAMLEEAKGTSVADILDVFKREDEMRAEIALLQKTTARIDGITGRRFDNPLTMG